MTRKATADIPGSGSGPELQAIEGGAAKSSGKARRRPTPGAPIRIVIVDDHVMFVEGLHLLLKAEDGIELTATAGTVTEAMEICRRSRPDVIVLDVGLPGGEGIAAIHDLQGAAPGAQVLVLSGSTDTRTVARAFDAGAVGYLTKSYSSEYLPEAIRRAAEGQVWMPEGDLGAVFASLRHERETERRQGSLTPRERQVLQLLSGGASVPEAASELHISVYTLRGHIRSLLRKLDVGSIAQAVAFAWRSGLIGPDSGPAPGAPAPGSGPETTAP